MYCNLTDGKKIGMPRYFKQKIYTDEQRKAIGLATRTKMLLEAKPAPRLSLPSHLQKLEASRNSMAIRLQQKDRF